MICHRHIPKRTPRRYRRPMRLPSPWTVVLCLALAGCSAAPFVHKGNEFDRSAPDFATEPDDIAAVTVCYSNVNTAPENVLDVARAECAKAGKKPRFSGQGYENCPLSTPVSAHFACVKP